MVNVENFAERLNIIMEYYELTSAMFADKIEVQRSSISHILSGRNKPSLDFVLKVLKEFPEVELYWLLNGVGSFPKSETKPIEKTTAMPPTLFSEDPTSSEKVFEKNEGNQFLKNVNGIVAKKIKKNQNVLNEPNDFLVMILEL